jgi:hypothetical protein
METINLNKKKRRAPRYSIKSKMHEKSIGANSALSAPLSNPASYVDFKGADDPEHPQNWRLSKK